MKEAAEEDEMMRRMEGSASTFSPSPAHHLPDQPICTMAKTSGDMR